MIHIRFNETKQVEHLSSEGHAIKARWHGWKRSVPYREVCAAISTLEYQFVYSIKKLTRLDIQAKAQKGSMTLHIHASGALTSDQKSIWQTLSHSLLIGLRMVQERYPHQLKLQLEGEPYVQ